MAADASSTITVHPAPGVQLRPPIAGFQPWSVDPNARVVPQSQVAQQPDESLPEGSPKETSRPAPPAPSACGEGHREHCEPESSLTCAEHRHMRSTCQFLLGGSISRLSGIKAGSAIACDPELPRQPGWPQHPPQGSYRWFALAGE